MKRLVFVLGAAVVVLLWLAEGKAQAEPIQWSISGGPIGTTTVASRNFNLNGTIQLRGGIVPWHPTIGAFSESVPVVTLRAYFASPSQDPLRFGGPLGNYSLNLKLTDLASGASSNLTFGGNLSGTISTDQVDLTNTVLDPAPQTLTLGQNKYTVMLGPFVPPGPLTRNYAYVGTPTYFSEPDGSISVTVQVATPEPSSLLLACLGLSPLGLAGWFRRRKVVDSNA